MYQFTGHHYQAAGITAPQKIKTCWQVAGQQLDAGTLGVYLAYPLASSVKQLQLGDLRRGHNREVIGEGVGEGVAAVVIDQRFTAGLIAKLTAAATESAGTIRTIGN